MDFVGKKIDGTATQSATSGAFEVAESLRVLGLTILFHPDGERVGERALLESLGRGSEEALSRQAPDFAAPGHSLSRPLADRRLSRTPIKLRREGAEILIDRAGSRPRLSVDNEEVRDTARVGAEALEEGVVLLLARRVVLLLHWLDPVFDPTAPRFGLVGESPAMVRLRRDIVLTADLQVPILILGESGSGKELVARAIHDAGPRRDGPYIPVNMAAIPSELASAELFGAERGAFTGADRRRAGHFERAHQGSLFLDEIGESSLDVQALLLRALETGEIQAVGGGRSVGLDVRVLAATDADLDSATESERFRAPLLHRLSGYVLRLPALRDRREDFGRLSFFFLRRELEVHGKSHLLGARPSPWLPAPLFARLAAWHWPGNVRQLANVMRQLVVANRDADPANRFDEVEKLLAGSGSGSGAAPARTGFRKGPAPRRQAADLSEQEVLQSLRAHQFRPAATADALGIPRSSIYDLMKRIPGLRKASDLTLEEIEQMKAKVGPSLEAVAAALEVSQRALRRRIGQLKP